MLGGPSPIDIALTDALDKIVAQITMAKSAVDRQDDDVQRKRLQEAIAKLQRAVPLIMQTTQDLIVEPNNGELKQLLMDLVNETDVVNAAVEESAPAPTKKMLANGKDIRDKLSKLLASVNGISGAENDTIKTAEEYLQK